MFDIGKCQITRYPAEVLTKPAQEVERIDESIKKLAEKMTDIMLEHKGIGLAGPQAGVPLRIFIISLDGTRQSVRVYINPTVKAFGKTIATDEGCLSVPGVYTKIRRFKRCIVTATGLDGREFTEEAEGLYAKCLQHEYDHISGVTIADKMSAVAKIAHRKKLQELREQQEK